MSDNVISVSNISKCYQVFDNQRSKFLHAIWPAHTKGMQEIWALKNINFEIKRGEAVAIIGRNGGGKSTLLQILTGTLTPTSGEVKINGRVSALLELGSGFNPEYSGRENVILNGLLLGLSREDILNRFDEIEAFAEIGTAIDRPVKTYSSGMMMRLAFAVQVLCDPDILIIDEALSVGDFFFQQKCLNYIRVLCEKGVTLLFVSHDMGTVRDLCPRVLYLNTSELVFDGAGSEGISQFFNEKQPSLQNHSINSSIVELLPEYNSLKECIKDAIWSSNIINRNGKLIAVTILDKNDSPKLTFKIGDVIKFIILYNPQLDMLNLITLVIKDRFGTVITTTGSLQLGIFQKINDSKLKLFEIEVNLMLEANEYSFEIFLGYETSRNRGMVLDETGKLGPIKVTWDYENDIAPFLGKFGLPVSAKYKDMVLK